MFCQKCGQKIEAGSRFCGSCGQAVQSAASAYGSFRTESPKEKPDQVKLAVKILYGVIIYSFILGLIDLPESIKIGGSQALLGLFVAPIFQLWIVRKISIGRNWARWVITISCAFGILTMLFSFSMISKLGGLAVYGSAIGMVVDVVAVVMLWSTNSTDWFR